MARHRSKLFLQNSGFQHEDLAPHAVYVKVLTTNTVDALRLESSGGTRPKDCTRMLHGVSYVHPGLVVNVESDTAADGQSQTSPYPAFGKQFFFTSPNRGTEMSNLLLLFEGATVKDGQADDMCQGARLDEAWTKGLDLPSYSPRDNAKCNRAFYDYIATLDKEGFLMRPQAVSPSWHTGISAYRGCQGARFGFKSFIIFKICRPGSSGVFINSIFAFWRAKQS